MQESEKAKIKALVGEWRWRIAKAKLTQGEFAEKHAKISNAGLSEYLMDKKMPRPKTVEKVEKALENLGV